MQKVNFLLPKREVENVNLLQKIFAPPIIAKTLLGFHILTKQKIVNNIYF